MLLDRALGLAEKIDRYEKLKVAAGQAELYRTRAAQFAVAKTALTDARVALSRFDEAAILVDFEATNADVLLEKATSLRDSFRSDPAVLNTLAFNLKHEFFERISGLSTFAKAALDKAWRSYVDAQGVNSSSEVLDALMKLPQFRASVITIKACRERIDSLAAQTPSDVQSSVKTLEGLVRDHRSAWFAISADGIPENMIKFLRTSAADGIPLSEVTDEIRQWLESKGLLSYFRVRIG